MSATSLGAGHLRDGSLHHIGVVTDDFDGELRMLRARGAVDVPLETPTGTKEYFVHGAPFSGHASTRLIKVSLGGVVLELFGPADEPSPWREFLDEHGPGIHHICWRVDDVAAATAAEVALGGEVLSHVLSEGRMTRSYCRPTPTAAFAIEYLE